jgi:hypothetical protein
MRTPLPSVKPKQRFRPNVETLEPRCTPFATAVQFGNSVFIAADPAGGTMDIFDNGTSAPGAIQVFSQGIPIFTLGAAFNPAVPITVTIFGSNKNDTVSYNLMGNLIGQSGPYPAPPGGALGLSAGRILTGDLGKGNTDTFTFNWPTIPAVPGGPGPLTAFASGEIFQAGFSLNIADHAKKENLSANLNVVAQFANFFVGLTGDKGVDNLAVQENILDASGNHLMTSDFPTVSNTTVVDGSKAQKGSQLLDLPVLTPGTTTAGALLTDQNLVMVFGNKKTTATVLGGPFNPGTIVMVNGIPAKNIVSI